MMALEIDYSAAPGYLIVRVRGQRTEQNARRAIDAIRDEANKRHETRLLLDLGGLEPPAREIDRFYTGEYLAKQLGPPFMTAAVWTPEYYTGFTQTAAANRGARFLVFFSRERAVEWLLG